MSQSYPLVSVVMCTYNGEKFLYPQLESIVRQTYTNMEIIISDDGSADNTLRIAKEFAEKDKRISIYTNLTNLGYNKNFEEAFKKASGEFIAISDQDDIWKYEKLEKMMSLFKNDQVQLAHSQSVRFKKKLPEISTYNIWRPFEGNDVRKLMYFNTIAGHNMLFRKTLLYKHSPFPENVFYDWWLAIMAATYGTIKSTDEVLTFHRFHASNITLGKKDEGRQTKQKAEERIHTLDAILQLKEVKPEYKAFAKQLRHALIPLQRKQFSFSLFSFLSRNSSIIFFFKKKSMLSRIKMAYRMSFALS